MGRGGGLGSVSHPHNFGGANIWMDRLIACWQVSWHSVFSAFGGGPIDVCHFLGGEAAIHTGSFKLIYK